MKVLSIAVILFFSITFAENSTTANQTQGSNEKAAVVSDDDELIIGDDEDIQKATKQESVVPDTTKHSVTPDGSATTAKSEPSTNTGTTAKPATATPATSVKTGAQVTDEKVDDELKLDGEEESILEPVKQENIVADTITSKTAVSVDKAQISDPTAANQSPDSTVSTPGVRGRGYVPPTETAFVKKNADPQTIGATGSINFARNMKDYRSPKLAMLMSLVLPGSGQVYAAHHSWKAAIYGAVEVGMIATSAVLRTKGIKKEKDAHKYADQHYNIDKYLKYQRALKTNVSDTTYSNIFYFGSDTFFINDAKTKNESYYEKIGNPDDPFINGWDDALPEFDDNLKILTEGYRSLKDSAYLVYYGTDSTNSYYGFSNNQKTYISMISKSGNYFSKSGLVLAIMLVNHLVSAIDAGLTAKAHNDLLLNKKSVWNHIGLEQICLSDGRQMVPGYALKVRF
jgi:hypothetical protein